MTARSIRQLLEEDTRYTLEAYQFVREALAYANDVLNMSGEEAVDETDETAEVEHHLSGQQLCEAIRQYAVEQYGYMTQVVLKNWGITCTGDFGEIVYNLINIKMMKKSPHDRREDFNDVYDFDQAFREDFRITPPPAS